MKKIIVPILISFTLLVCNSAIAQSTETNSDTLKVEKKETQKAKIKVKLKTGNTVGVHTVQPADPQEKITVNEEGVKDDKVKKKDKKEQTVPVETTADKTKPAKGEEKKGTEVNELKKGGN